MYQFFVDPSQINEEYISIVGDDVNHIKNVLRMRIGEKVRVSDGESREYECSIDTLEEEQILVRIEDVFGSNQELPVRITLFQGLPKADKMELIIQKAVELGVSEIVPVATKRTVVKLDAKKEQKKVERWNTIAKTAAKQSKRGIIPEVSKVMRLNEAFEYAKAFDMNLIPYENAKGMDYARSLVKKVKKQKSLGIFIGPEGGFDETEVKKANELGIESISLGHRILRTETAGMTILSIIMFEIDEDEKDQV